MNEEKNKPIEIVLINKSSEKGSSSFWDKIEKITLIISVIAIPVIIALIGNSIKASLTDKTVNKEYVQIAVSILSNPSTAEQSNLRGWALSLLNFSSPIKIDKETKEELKSGITSLPKSTHPFYTIQVLSTPKREAATQLTDKLSSLGWNAIAQSFKINGNTYFRVFVGSFTQKNKAQQAKAKLAKSFPEFKGSFITFSME